MWRRRPPRRPLRRPPLGRPMRNIPPKLLKANRLFQNGDYQEAAKLYEELAEKEIKNQIPQAPRLLLQAGAAWIKADEKERGMKSIESGLELLAERKKWAELKRAATVAMDRIKEHGLDDKAREIEIWLEKNVPAEVRKAPVWVNATKPARGMKKAQLPTNCPRCGGPVNPKEVEWFDSSTASCIYCGSMLRGD